MLIGRCGVPAAGSGRLLPSHTLRPVDLLSVIDDARRSKELREMRAPIGKYLLIVLSVAGAAVAAAQAHNPAAVRLNNRGVALMGQQFTQRAEDSFAQAFKQDPKLAQAAINDGIALYTLQKLDAAKKALRQAIALDPKSAQAWYELGLTQHAGNELDAAVASFQHAAALDPHDADSLYFEGACYEETRQFDKAIAVFRKVLAINPLHASAEFGLARSLQRTGHIAEARQHFQRFQHLTSTKIGSPIGLAYGDQGHYSTVRPVKEPETVAAAMISVQLVEEPMLTGKAAAGFTGTGGACMLDTTG